MRFPVLAAFAFLAACGAPPSADNGSNVADLETSTPEPAAPSEPAPAAGAVIPAPFHGTFDRDLPACARPSEYRLRVEPKALRFHESMGTVTRVVAEGPGRIAVESDFEGEGERWSAAHRLALSGDGARLTISGEGTDFTRARCPGGGEAAGWDSSASGEGAGLTLTGADGKRLATLFCPAGGERLVVNVPAFRPVGSEERMSFGAGGTVTVLVADTAGDGSRGGVTGESAIPEELETILASPAGIAVNYGYQNAGPFPRVPSEAAKAFAAGCRG